MVNDTHWKPPFIPPHTYTENTLFVAQEMMVSSVLFSYLFMPSLHLCLCLCIIFHFTCIDQMVFFVYASTWWWWIERRRKKFIYKMLQSFRKCLGGFKHRGTHLIPSSSFLYPWHLYCFDMLGIQRQWQKENTQLHLSAKNNNKDSPSPFRSYCVHALFCYFKSRDFSSSLFIFYMMLRLFGIVYCKRSWTHTKMLLVKRNTKNNGNVWLGHQLVDWNTIWKQ